MTVLNWLAASIAGVMVLIALVRIGPTPAARAAPKFADRPGQEAVVNLTGEMNNAVVGPLNVVGPFRLVESSKTLRARNLVIRQVTARQLQRDGVRLRGDIDGAQVQHFRLEMRGEPQVRPQLPIGIAIASGRRIVLSDGLVRGFRMARVKGKYTNGDGVATERKVDDLTIRRVVATDNSDAGFDLKSSNTKLDEVRAERNGRNYRFWSSVEAGTLTSIDPRQAHVWAGKGARVHIRRLVARSKRPAAIIHVEKAGGVVVVDSCDLQVPPGTPLVRGDSAGVRLGSGCRAR